MASSKLYWERKSGEEETSERYELWLRKLGFDNNNERGVFDSTQKGLVFSREIPKTKKNGVTTGEFLTGNWRGRKSNMNDPIGRED